jgi:hypothetical protein
MQFARDLIDGLWPWTLVVIVVILTLNELGLMK